MKLTSSQLKKLLESIDDEERGILQQRVDALRITLTIQEQELTKAQLLYRNIRQNLSSLDVLVKRLKACA